MKQIGYVLKVQDAEGQWPCYIALDQASGGYPYTVDSLLKANVFQWAVDAVKYRDSMKRKSDWELIEVAEDETGVHVVSP